MGTLVNLVKYKELKNTFKKIKIKNKHIATSLPSPPSHDVSKVLRIRANCHTMRFGRAISKLKSALRVSFFKGTRTLKTKGP